MHLGDEGSNSSFVLLNGRCKRIIHWDVIPEEVEEKERLPVWTDDNLEFLLHFTLIVGCHFTGKVEGGNKWSPECLFVPIKSRERDER